MFRWHQHSVSLHKELCSNLRGSSLAVQKISVCWHLNISEIVGDGINQDLQGVSEEDHTTLPRVITSDTIPDASPLVIPSEEESDESVEEKKRKKANKSSRVKWQHEEEAKLKQHFRTFLRTKTTLGKKECLQAVSSSREKKGLLWHRSWPLIVKKISNMHKKPWVLLQTAVIMLVK